MRDLSAVKIAIWPLSEDTPVRRKWEITVGRRQAIFGKHRIHLRLTTPTPISRTPQLRANGLADWNCCIRKWGALTETTTVRV